MAIKEDIIKVGQLAKIEFSQEEIKNLSEQIEKIINYFKSLRELDLKGVKPTSHIIDTVCPRREDKKEPQENILDKFPYVKFRYFQVPMVLEELAEAAKAESE